MKTFCGVCNVKVEPLDNHLNVYVSHLTDAGLKSVEGRFHEWCAPSLVREMRHV